MLLSVTTRILNFYASQSPVTIGAPRLPFLENQPHLIFNCVSVNRSCVCLCPVCLTPGSAKIPPITSVAGSPLTYHPVPLLLLLLHCTYLSLHSWGCIANHPDSIGDQGCGGRAFMVVTSQLIIFQLRQIAPMNIHGRSQRQQHLTIIWERATHTKAKH